MYIFRHKEQHCRYNNPIGIIIRHGTQNNACGQLNTLLFSISCPLCPQQGMKDHRHRKHSHGIRIDIGMNENILGQKYGHYGKYPLQIGVLPRLLRRFPYIISHKHAKNRIYHTGRQQQHIAVRSEQL